MGIKLIALDLDGTTLNNSSEFTTTTVETLNSAMNRGIHVVIATGRVYSALPQELTKLPGIEYVITSNGAAITDLKNHKLIYENCIGEMEVYKVYELLSRHSLMVEVFIKGKAYMEKHIWENLEKVGLPESSMKYVRKTRLPYENVLELMVENKKHIENINLVFGNKTERVFMKKKLLELDNVTITSSVAHNIEIGGETTSKASALQKLCLKLDVKRQEIMACGDSSNDKAMLELAGFPVAVGNAKEELKAVAKHITATNDEDGVALAIQRFVLK